MQPFQPSAALGEYTEAFATDASSMPFLTYYSINADKSLSTQEVSRGEFWLLACKAASVLQRVGLGFGDCTTHFFSDNTVGDLVFRLASVMMGTTPCTINWQADAAERVVHKVSVTKSRLVLVDSSTPKEMIEQIVKEVDGVVVYDVGELEKETPAADSDFCCDSRLGADATRIIIFTSGTTGLPKGVQLSYRAYRCNRETFESFLEAPNGSRIAPIVVNPLHHTNSTALTDWAMRKPGAHLHLVQRYSTLYWKVLSRASTSFGIDETVSDATLLQAISERSQSQLLIAPLVSRHFDFLESLWTGGGLPVDQGVLHAALTKTILLLGSAPVGPTTVARLQEYCGKLPTVRFGSTETCLQVMGTPLYLSEQERHEAFKAGWNHTYAEQLQVGYYIGRPHPPFTACRIVKSVDPEQADFMKDCEVGEPGQLVTKGENLMSGYVAAPEATAKALREDGWYTNLGDVAFYLKNSSDDACARTLG
mmetsp:Transcript_33027/g.77211  ORF Transcript_33027/g.77211 Transcript_33027/m.77211 type:complete len:480 (-) Transcript_33027:466-1905(-)